MSEREFDVVLFGATSVTGRQVAAYLAGRAAESAGTWAAAGRDAARVESVLADVGVNGADTIVGDVSDPASLETMASRARVVLNLVGPYTRYGRPVIAACVAAGTHYVDLTGEIPFVRRMIEEFDAPAREAGVKVVQVCGFEALPPDLAVRRLAEDVQAAGERLADVDLQVTTTAQPPGRPRASDFMSGGTLQSTAEATRDRDAAILSDPGCLVAVADPSAAAAIRARSPISLAPRRGDRGQAIAPMIPAPFINPGVIHRSAFLADPAAPPFRYREGVAIPGGTATLPLRLGVAGALAGTQAALMGLTKATPALRERIGSGMSRILPDSGFGPAADRLEQWRWRLDVTGRGTGGHEARLTVEGDGHPGYLATSRMLGEAGLLLAEGGATPDTAGHLTPAAALGTAKLDRFDRAGLRFRTA